MRTALALVAFSLASTLSAANMWFDPPNPTSTTNVVAHVAVSGSYCTPTNVAAERHGDIISITMSFPPCARPPLPGTFDVPVNLGVVPPGIYDVVAGPDQILLGLAEGTLVVRDANPPFVVTPDAGREGDRVTITGVNNCASPTQCDTVGVLFGTTAATIVTNTPNGITVQVPAIAAGPTNVTVAGKTSIAAFDATTGNVFDPAFFAPVLVPVFFSSGGANGSQWVTDLAFANDNAWPALSDSPIFIVFCGTSSFVTKPATVVSCPSSHIAAGQSGFLTGGDDVDGKLIYFDRAALPRLFLDARVRDRSRDSLDLGAELPVVRDNKFYGRPFDLLPVPTDSRFRVTLRFYRIDGGASVHIRVRPMFDLNPATLVETDVPLHAAGKLQSATISDLLGTYPQLAGHPQLMITVDGQTPQPVTWAMASVTNNVTQRVTIISPQ